MKRYYFFGGIAILCFSFLLSKEAYSQNVRIGATSASPNAASMLEVDGVTGVGTAYKGLLIPRMTYAQRTSLVTLAAAAQGLLVYQTDVSGTYLEGFYYNTSTTTTPNWVYMGSTAGWGITGNSNVTAASNFIGTTISQDFIVKTNGSASTNERMRVASGGNIIVNNTGIGTNTDDIFSVYGNGSTNGSTSAINSLGLVAIAGYTGANAGVGVYGENRGTGVGVMGVDTGSTLTGSNSAYAVLGYNTTVPNSANSTSTSVGAMGWVASNVTAGEARGVQGAVYSTTGKGVIGFALATTGTPVGVQGQSDAVNGSGVSGFSSTTTSSSPNLPTGVYGQSASIRGVGVTGYNTNTSGGAGVSGAGVNQGTTLPVAGCGGSFTGKALGALVYATSTSGSGGTGLAVANNGYALTYVTSTGSAIVGNSDYIGVAGYSNLGGSAGGYFDSPGGYAYVGAYSGGLSYKILGSGSVSTIVNNTKGERVALVAPEAPEALFMDFGKATLMNGTVHISLDPDLALNIVVNNNHPLRVVLTPEGNCNQLYYSNTSNDGFDVTESNNGNSNTSFTWMVIANRADQVMPNGLISKFSEARFAPAMGPRPKANLEVIREEHNPHAAAEPGNAPGLKAHKQE